MKELFLKALNRICTEKDEVMANLEAVRNTVFDTAGQERREKAEQYLRHFAKQEDIIMKFEDDIWYALADYVTVYDKQDIRCTFKDGTEIKI